MFIVTEYAALKNDRTFIIIRLLHWLNYLFISGPISRGQVLTVQPFGNTIDMIKIKGVFLKQAFENSVKRYDPSDLRGAFLQMSGKKF